MLSENCHPSTAIYVASYVGTANLCLLTMKFYSIFGNPSGLEITQPTNNIDDDDQTVAASENRSSKEREMREFCVKWVFPMTNDKRKILRSHHAILGMMMKEHEDLVVVDNKAREHTEKKTMISSETHRPFDFYVDQRNKNNKTLVCIHRIRSKTPLSELKEAWGVLEELRKHKAYVRNHAFNEKDREISHIGFIPGVNMLHTPKEVVKDEILSMLKRDNQEVPNFEIVQVRVDMGKDSGPSARTRAYEIQCPYREASTLAKRLQSGTFKTNPVYVPYRMKRSDPKTFKEAIKKQIKVLTEQWVIKIRGFTSDMIQHVNNKILESKVEAVVPTRAREHGEWKLLVPRSEYGKTMKWLSENWNSIIELIPQEVMDASNLENPKITSKNSQIYESNSEDGTVDTYGTILSALYYGTEDNEEVQSDVSESEAAQSECTTQRPITYAKVTKGTTSIASPVSGWTDHRNDEFAQLQEKHSTLEDKFNEVTAELGELKLLLQQLISQGQQQATNEPPTKKQATFETPKRTDRRRQHYDEPESMEHEPADNGSNTGNFQNM